MSGVDRSWHIINNKAHFTRLGYCHVASGTVSLTIADRGPTRYHGREHQFSHWLIHMA